MSTSEGWEVGAASAWRRSPPEASPPTAAAAASSEESREGREWGASGRSVNSRRDAGEGELDGAEGDGLLEEGGERAGKRNEGRRRGG